MPNIMLKQLLFLALFPVVTIGQGVWSCPPVGSDVVGTCVEGCSSDGECKEGEKCCSNGCGHQCTPAIQLAEEICPLLQREKDGGICIEECSNDDDCSEGKMCCSNGCGHQCTIPYTVRPNLGSCPQVKPGEGGTCVEGCSSDGECKEGEKCCSNGCGHQCTPAECPIDGQVYSTCASSCIFTCENHEIRACNKMCTTNCDCQKGHMIDTDAGKCVPPKECPEK